MYRTEVPAYGTLIDIVGQINADHEGIRSDGERHGAIRLGTAAELNLIGRVFAVLGLYPVGYYDLSVAGLPVHSTAFRPITKEGFETSPFRMWRKRAHVDLATYQALLAEHPLIADIVSFQGPHMNHLTPRVADIDAAQEMMAKEGLEIKDKIEGPPRRNVPILLRQTAFKALTESVEFETETGWKTAKHSARFGEIEQRGAALTPKGRALYDSCLAQKNFAPFPDTHAELKAQQLAYYTVAGEPLTYEDFLPVSAAGIFKSNLRESESVASHTATGNQAAFETALGKPVLDMFELYASAS